MMFMIIIDFILVQVVILMMEYANLLSEISIIILILLIPI